MKIILIGEDHSNPIARNMVLNLIEKNSARKVQFMIEMEPNDFAKFIKDAALSLPDEKQKMFGSLAEIFKMSENEDLNITPIDIPLSPLLKGIKDKLDGKSSNTKDKILNEILDESWDNSQSIQTAVDLFFPSCDVSNSDMLPLKELLEFTELKNLTKMMAGENREEFYKKKAIQQLRDKYFSGKITQEYEKLPEVLIILVGTNHFANLEKTINEVLNENNDNAFHKINCPRDTQVKDFIAQAYKKGESTHNTSTASSSYSNTLNSYRFGKK